MADTKITALTALTAADPINDVIPIVDVSDTSMAASGTTKKISVNNILGASGTATLASATITGDLTVDTSTLKVDSTLNRVGILTASPSNTFQVGDGSADSRAFFFSNNDFSLAVGRSNAAIGGYIGSPAANVMVFSSGAGVEQYRITAPGIFSWSDGAGGTRMTLNATGLGVGTSPSRKLSVSGAGGGLDVTDTTQSTRIRMRSSSASNFYIEALNSAESAYVTLRLNDTTQIDSSGNVGIGVTPSAWAVSYKSIEVGAIGSFANDPTNVSVGANRFFNGTNSIYKTTAAASVYNQTAGTHAWYTAPSGTAGNAITFTQAMTLDASGNLLVGRTTALGGKIGAQVEGGNGSAYLLRHNGATAGKYRIFAIDSSNNGLFYDQNNVGMFMADAGTSWVATSDETQKDIIEPISNAILKVGSLRAVIGKFKTDVNSVRRSFLIAQDVKTALPEAVHQKDGLLGLSYTDVIPLLVAAIKELTAEVNALKNA